MPTRATRTTSPRTVLRVTELERRDTPAWWSVAAPVPAEGVAGTTDVTHSGSLTLNPDYAATNGAITVWADTATEAAAKGINGTITVTLLGQSVEYEFSPETVGTSVADHKAFYAVANGTSVSIKLEDMAGRAGSDWDYDDRTWGGVTVSSAPDPVVSFPGPTSWLWNDPQHDEMGAPNETVTVALQVTRPTPATLRRRYTLTNNDLSLYFGRPDINQFVITPENGSGVTKMTTSLSGWLMESSAGSVSWRSPTPGSGPFVSVGNTATFGFDTPSVPVTPANGGVSVAGIDQGGGMYYTLSSGAGGPTMGPGDDGIQVVIADRHGTPIGTIDANGVPNTLKVGKWENAFDIAGNKATVKQVNPTTGFDIIDLDDDRFNVWVYDKVKWDANTQHAQVKISTDNVVGFTQYNDDPTLVDMIRYIGTAKGQGWFWSDSQLLVSNKVDDIGPVPGVGADDTATTGTPGRLKHTYNWATSDRTHRVALRGTVKAEYTPDAGAAVSDSKLVPSKHTVDAHVLIFNAPDVNGIESNHGVLTENEVDKDFRQANEQYAQVGIILRPRYNATYITWSKYVNLSDGIDTTDIIGGSELYWILRSNINNPHDTTVKVFYVNYFTDGSRGNAVAAASSITPARLADSLVISTLDRTPFTLGHEIGHVLTNVIINNGHVNTGSWPVNLMRDGTSAADAIDATKRFAETQDILVNKERPKLLK